MVQLDDLVRTVLFFLKPEAPSRIALEIAGPERLSLDEVLVAYRRWLGRGDARFVTVPRWLATRRVSRWAISSACSAGGRRCAPPRGSS